MGSLPSRGAWIEIKIFSQASFQFEVSLPSRGAWIEIPPPRWREGEPVVAPLTGSVD